MGILIQNTHVFYKTGLTYSTLYANVIAPLRRRRTLGEGKIRIALPGKVQFVTPVGQLALLQYYSITLFCGCQGLF